MKSGVWLSYDLGMGANYEQLYIWLNKHGAKECGDSCAFFLFDFDKCENAKERMKMLQDSLKSSISVDNDTRVYVIVSGTENNEEHSYGRFIFGKRKINAPWKDYGYEEATEDRV